MEDQQPAADDLTATTSDAETEPDRGSNDQPTDAADLIDAEAASEAEQSDLADAGETGTDQPDASSGDAEAGTGNGTDKAAVVIKRRKVRRKRLTGRRLAWVAALITALLFVGSAAFAGATLQPYLSDRAIVAVKLKVARTAANAITTLWTYTPENMDSLADRAATYLSGDFGAQYRKFVDSIVAPNKQAKVTNSTEVTGVAVESLDGPNAVAIVYTNTTTTSPLTKNIPAMKYLSYRLIMKRDRARWFVTRMTTITSLDLTPRL